MRLPTSRERCCAWMLCLAWGCAAWGWASEWEWGVGPVYRRGIRVSADGSAYIRPDTAPPPVVRRSLPSPLGAVSDAAGYADRRFDDGFVFRDAATGLPGSFPSPDATWYWGYNDAEQYQPANDRLLFSGQLPPVRDDWERRVTRQLLTDTRFTDRTRVDADGWSVSIGRRVAGRDRFRVVLLSGLDVTRAETAWLSATTYRERFRSDRYAIQDTLEYAYDLNGVVPPPAPYAGDYAGAPGQPVIPNQPSALSYRRNRTRVGMTVWETWNQVDIRVRCQGGDLWVAPRLDWLVRDNLAIILMPRLTVGWLSVAIERNEWLFRRGSSGVDRTVMAWRDRRRDDDWTLGGGGLAGVEYGAENGFVARVMAGYHTTWRSHRFDIGPNRVSIKPDGMDVQLAAGWRFP